MPLPLKNLKILDLSRLLPGPYAAMILAEFGAEVIKIEEPVTGDYIRRTGPAINGESAFFLSLNRNKKSLTLNLKSRKGQEILRKLVQKSDVLIEGFRPGVMEEFGLGYESLKKVNPRLIYCAVTGYGQRGPYARKAGHDLNYMARSGLLDNLKTDGGPIVPRLQIADVTGGTLQTVIGILLALLHRGRTGEGQLVDVSMFEGALMFLPLLLANLGVQTPPPNPVSGYFACYAVYPTQDGRFFSVACYEEKFWREFSRALAHEEWIPIQYEKDASVQNQLKKEITKIFKNKPFLYWENFFKPMNCCVEPVHHLKEVLADPQIRAGRTIFQKNGILNLNFPVKFSNMTAAAEAPPPRLGEHMAEILSELGFSRSEIERLKSDHVI